MHLLDSTAACGSGNRTFSPEGPLLAVGVNWVIDACGRRKQSDLRLFCHFQSVVDLDPEVPYGAFYRRMIEQ
jgi:hypothetical protein